MYLIFSIRASSYDYHPIAQSFTSIDMILKKTCFNTGYKHGKRNISHTKKPNFTTEIQHDTLIEYDYRVDRITMDTVYKQGQTGQTLVLLHTD